MIFNSQISHVLRFTGMSEEKVPVQSIVKGDVFRLQEGGPWYRATCSAYLTEGTAGGYAVHYEPQELLLENK